ncbi:mitochondrial protein [Planoprotostelium fungivorum]|uniref:Mitochondrial protein n=1 Tax=Planoprotostelium fungivorum TaxID=1890364 RepID=A0A2P6NNR5_9EUKA|nr:mitochondrial protein [Planoprotostelium fungivorum]
MSEDPRNNIETKVTGPTKIIQVKVHPGNSKPATVIALTQPLQEYLLEQTIAPEDVPLLQGLMYRTLSFYNQVWKDITWRVKILSPEHAFRLGWKPGDPHYGSMIIKPIDRMPWRLSAGAEFSNATGLQGQMTAGHINVLGSGETVTAKVVGRSHLELNFEKPELGRAYNAYGLTIKTGPSLDLAHPWTQRSTGASAYLTRGLAFMGRERFEYKCEARNFVPHMDAPLELRLSAGDSFLSSIKYSYLVDRRDSPITPTLGYAYKFACELAGLGGDVRFFRQVGALQYNYPLYPGGWSAGLAVRGETVLPLNDRLRASDKIWAGGPGFKAYGIGPSSRGKPLGGDVLGSVTANVRTPDFSEDVPIHLNGFVTATTLVDSGVTPTNLKGPAKQFVDPQHVRVFAGISLVVPFPQLGRVEVGISRPIKIESHDRLDRLPLTFSLSASFADIC